MMCDFPLFLFHGNFYYSKNYGGLKLTCWWGFIMSNKINELLKFSQEMEAIGAADDTAARRIEARIKAQELKKKFTNPKPMTGEDIKRIREQNNISQSSLALISNMTKESVSKWERGEIKPNGAALRLLTLIDEKVFII